MAARNVILAEFQPWDPVAGAVVPVRVCSADDVAVTGLSGQRWWPVIARSPRRTLDLFDGEFGGGISAGIGDMEFALSAHPDAPRYAWGERPVKLWRGALGDAFGSYTQIFNGLTKPPRAGGGRMQIGLRVDDRWMDKPLLATYAGTGGVEGPADLKGVPKPLAIGAPQFIEGVIVNRTLNIVQLHGYGAMHAIGTALDRLSRYSASAGNDASYSALAAATIAPGAWRTCLAEGLVRFGAPPGGVASFLAQGDSGSALGWVRKPGEVIRRLALIAGATTGQIDAASLAALDAAVPFNLSLHLKEQTTAREIIQAIAASANAAAGVSWLGQLFVTRAAIGTPALTIAADGSRLPPVASVEMLETSAPFWRIGLQAAPTFRVHAAGEYGDIGNDGVRTFRQTETPVGASNGDLWFRPNYANAQFRYEGTGSVTVAIAGTGITYGGTEITYPIGSWVPVRDELIQEAQRTANAKTGLVAQGLARDGDVITFSPALDRVPTIIFGSGGNVGSGNRVVAADGLSISGFTMRAVSQAVGTVTNTTDTGATAGGAGEPDRVIDRTNSAAPFDGRYSVTYSVYVAPPRDIAPGEPGEPGAIYIGVFIKRSGSWIQVGSDFHASTGTKTTVITPGAVDFGAGAEFGVSVVGVDGLASLTSFNSVAYSTATTTDTTLTPADASAIEWTAWV